MTASRHCAVAHRFGVQRRAWTTLRTGLSVLLLAGLASCGEGGTEPVAESEALTVRIEGGDAQQGLPGMSLRNRITVRVTGPDGLPRAQARLEAEVVSGSGTISPRQFRTNPDGLAFLDWKLGPEPGEQRLALTSLDSTEPASTTATARALAEDETDVVIVRGAAAPLLGAVVFVPGGVASPAEILQDRVIAGADSVVTLFPEAGRQSQVVVFGTGNPPGRVEATWTTGVDTVVVSLRPAIPVDLVVDSYRDSLGPAVPFLLEQARIMDSVWASEGMGLTLGEITVNHAWRSGVRRDVRFESLCGNSTEPRGAVRVAVVHSIDGGAYNGVGCTNGNVWMGGDFERSPTLLAHELGHVFSLVHSPSGVMRPRPPGNTFTEGEVFRAHFNDWSGLNSVLEGWPVGDRLGCAPGREDSPCLPTEYELGGG